MRRMIVVAVWITAAVALASCGSHSSPGSDPQASSTSAAPAATASGPAATSQYDGGPRAADTPIDESKVEHGQQLFKTKGCSACHTFGQKLTGPDLAGVTHRRTAAWMEHQILHPEIMTKEDPISHELFAKFMLQMPNQGLTPEEAAAVVEFFKHTDHEAAESASKGE